MMHNLQCIDKHPDNANIDKILKISLLDTLWIQIQIELYDDTCISHHITYFNMINFTAIMAYIYNKANAKHCPACSP